MLRNPPPRRRGSTLRPTRWMIALVLVVGALLLFLLLRDRLFSNTAKQAPSYAYSNNNSEDDGTTTAADATTTTPDRRLLNDNIGPNDAVDTHLFVIWHDALHKRREILSDISGNFLIYEIAYMDWPKESPPKHTAPEEDPFLMNLWRLYSGKGGWEKHNMKLKVSQCGRGPFLAIVVGDRDPIYKKEKTAHGVDLVNHRMNSAKQRYREWSGGGFRVHGTFNTQEAAHDIALLFSRPADMFQGAVGTAKAQAKLLANILENWPPTASEKHYTKRWTLGWTSQEWPNGARLKQVLLPPYQHRLQIGCGSRMEPLDDYDNWCNGSSEGEDAAIRIVVPSDIPLMGVASLLNGKRLSSDSEVKIETTVGSKTVLLLVGDSK